MEITQVIGITTITLHTILFVVFLGFILVNIRTKNKTLQNILKMFLIFGSAQFVIISFELIFHIFQGSSIYLHMAVTIFAIPTLIGFYAYSQHYIKYLNSILISLIYLSSLGFIIVHLLYLTWFGWFEALELVEIGLMFASVISGYFAVISAIIKNS